MGKHPRSRPVLSFLRLGAGFFLAGVGCSLAADEVAGDRAKASTEQDVSAAVQAWRKAEALAATLPSGDVMVGCGDSMAPLFPDRTVIVIQRQALRSLRAGMTVVFLGEAGRPVAHQLLRRTARGWVVQGLANREPDGTLVAERNYIGTVVRAFLPAPRTGIGSRAIAALAFTGVAGGDQ